MSQHYSNALQQRIARKETHEWNGSNRLTKEKYSSGIRMLACGEDNTMKLDDLFYLRLFTEDLCQLKYVTFTYSQTDSKHSESVKL